MTREIARVVLAGVLLCMTAVVTSAQTTTSATKKFQVIAVDGNQLVVKLPEGTRELTVPANFQFNVDGKMLSVSELKPGMAGTATITTTTTSVPVTVTEVKNGTVMKALGTAIVVRTDEGMKMFSQSDIDKRGVRIMREGKPAMIADFRENDRLTATIITAQPPRIVTEQEVQATLAKTEAAAPAAATRSAAPSAAPPTATPAPAAAPTSGAPRKTLPKTASFLPVLPLVGFASLAAGLALAVRRRRTTR